MLGRTQPLQGTCVIVKEKEKNNTMLQSMVEAHRPLKQAGSSLILIMQ
jgi:hypothetical protein